MTLLIKLLSLIAVASVYGGAACVAHATAPFWTVGGAKLAKNTEKAAATFNIKEATLTAGTSVITCQKGQSEGENLIGGVPGTAEGKLVYEGCTISGNGEKCGVTSKPGKEKGAIDKRILTETLKDVLVTSATTLAKGEKIDGVFGAASGSIIGKLFFMAETGGKCTLPEWAIEGKSAFEVLDSTKANVTLDGNEPEPEFGFAKSPSTAIASVSEDTETTMTEVKPSFKAFGKTATLVGQTELTLTKGGKFGAKTK